jgi:hypothetical protein
MGAKGVFIFDNMVLSETASFAIELVRCQYSGSVGGIIKGIPVVTYVYVNLAIDQC